MSKTYTDLNPSPRLLLGPGPSMVHPRVLRSMTTPLVGHLDPDFLDILSDVKDLLRFVFQTENELTLAVPGTGTAAMEAALSNLIEPGDRLLACIHGYFGERLAEMADRYGAQTKRLQRPWGEVFDPDEIDLALSTFPAKIVTLVHAETSTGALQPDVDAIAEICHRYGALLVLDCVTSLGGIPVTIDGWRIDAAYSGTQKCLSCPPGLSPVSFSERAVERVRERETPVQSWYLDVALLAGYYGSERIYHHTAPISAIYALGEGLRIIEEEGMEARAERHRRAAAALVDSLAPLGFEPLVAEEHRLPSLTTMRLPETILREGEARVRRRLLEEHGIEVGGGLGKLAGSIWRIGLMGENAREENVERLAAALR